MASKIPRGLQLPAETKRIGHKLEPKDAATANAAQKPDGILKAQNKNIPRKNVAPKVPKGISTRHGQQAELKEQNQQLLALNEELQKSLANTQQEVAELELHFKDMKDENAGLQKNLRDCHVLLVTAKMDPVSAERVGEAAQQNEDQRKEVMNISANLLNEIKAFGEMASEQRARLEEIQTAMTKLSKSQAQMIEEREMFSEVTAEMEKALKQAETLLL
ncbi:small kinetochore-associated protein [Takifugu rubripes]|uniref:Kinetochore localized astrin (SPAG5) binding protein n=1 Tax=Takifugu rubripes TaxID=31033 RepID=A0A3B5JXU6_TAKRU|nr:girdin-like [Takifugu rubripes]XP_011610577.2 girdin-like [Takifugu rubripes]